MESPRVPFWTIETIRPKAVVTSVREQQGSLPATLTDVDARATGRTRFLIGCVGFGLGAIVCLVLAVIEFAAWVLIAPPRSIQSGAFRDAEAAE